MAMCLKILLQSINFEQNLLKSVTWMIEYHLSVMLVIITFYIYFVYLYEYYRFFLLSARHCTVMSVSALHCNDGAEETSFWQKWVPQGPIDQAPIFSLKHQFMNSTWVFPDHLDIVF